MHAAVFEGGLECAVDKLMLLDQCFSRKRLRVNADIIMIERSRTIRYFDLSVGNLGANERCERIRLDHACNRGLSCCSAAASFRASPSMSGIRSPLRTKKFAAPAARTIPLTATKIAGTPCARIGPASSVKVF